MLIMVIKIRVLATQENNFFFLAIFDLLKELQAYLTICHEVLIFSSKSPSQQSLDLYR